MKEEKPDFSALFKRIGEKRETFGRFYQLLTECNAQFNLTSITGEEEVLHKHFLDSLAGEAFIPRGARVGEVGSGAGFPSLPLAIVRDDLQFTLIESTGKKCRFLECAGRELSLDVRVVQSRAEEEARGELRESFDAVIARAVAPLPALCEYCLPLVRCGGEMIAWKGEEDESAQAQAAVRALGGGRVRMVRYELPNGYGKRMLVIIKKIHPTPSKYPRGQGRERKDPIH